MESQVCSIGVEVTKIALPALLVIAGWAVVNNLTVKREKDKSRREMIAKSVDGLCDDVDKLLQAANDYHSSERDRKLEVKIKITLSDLSQQVVSLLQISQDKEKLTNCLTSIVKLRQAITGKHFEDEHSAVMNNNLINEEIAEATLAMRRCLVELKHSQFSFKTSAN